MARAQFLRKPSTPSRFPSWSLDHALDTLLTRRFENATATPRDLFLKTLFLVALATGNRASEIAACVRNGSRLLPTVGTLAVRASFLFKNQSLSRTPPPISFPGLGPDNQLCPVAALSAYLDRRPATDNSVFVHPSTGASLTASRLSYWLAQAIRIFAKPEHPHGGHDVRKLSHSAAWARGLSMTTILQQGFWSSPNVFINNYLTTLVVPARTFVAGCTIVRP